MFKGFKSRIITFMTSIMVVGSTSSMFPISLAKRFRILPVKGYNMWLKGFKKRFRMNGMIVPTGLRSKKRRGARMTDWNMRLCRTMEEVRQMRKKWIVRAIEKMKMPTTRIE